MFALDQDRSLLQRLIIAGEEAIANRRSNGDAEAVLELSAAVDRLLAKPADGPRTIDNHTRLFVAALSMCDVALRRHDNKAAAIYQPVLGVLLPHLRADFSRALERAQRPTA